MEAFIQGSYHQGDARYEGRGRQCTAMAMTALAYHTIKDVGYWDTNDVDLILEKGDTIFMEATKTRDVTMLLPSDISQTININNYKMNFSLAQSKSGVLCDNGDNESLDSFLNVLCQIEETAVVTFGQIFSSYAMGIIKGSGYFYVFDSHSRDDHGMCVVDGHASVTKHASLSDVAAFIFRISHSVGMNSDCFFDVVNVRVNSNSMSLESGSQSDEDDVPLLYLLQRKKTSSPAPPVSINEDLESNTSDDIPLAILRRQSHEEPFPYDSLDECQELFDDDYVPSTKELRRCDSSSTDHSMDDYTLSLPPSDATPNDISLEDQTMFESPELHPHTQAIQVEIQYNTDRDLFFSLSTNLTQDQKRQSRKRQRNPSGWKVNVSKRLRNAGAEYVTRSGKTKAMRILKSGCGATCRSKCHSRLTEEERSIIFHSFWGIGCLAKQRDYICKMVQKKEKKTSKYYSDSRRSHTYVYHLQIDNKYVQVCKKMFMDTLNISDTVVATAIKRLSNVGISGEETRGKHVQRGKTTEKELIRSHIDSFPRVESHYARKDSKREYLEGSLSLKRMYDMYREKRTNEGCTTPASENTYRSVFNFEFNISFHKRMKDRCDMCAAHDNDQSNKIEYDEHIRLKQESRLFKDKIKSSLKESTSTAAAVFDLEEVLSTPSSVESSLYYKRKLNTYNLTIYDYRTSQGFCNVWNETEAQRGSNEIASCVYTYLDRIKSGIKNVFLFSDSCGGQNRNKNFLSMLWIALQSFRFESIEHVFFVSGHSQNEGDSMHSVIERSSRNVPVYTPGQWAQLIRSAKRKHPIYKVDELDRSNFYDFKAVAALLKNFELDTERERIKWLKVKRFRLTSNEPNIVSVYYDYSDNCKKLNLTQKLRTVHTIPNALSISLENVSEKPYPLNRDKYKDLISLCEKGIIPRAHHDFYKSLPHET